MGTVLHKRYGIEVCETTLQRIMSRRGLTARIRQVRKAKPSAGKATRQQLPDNLLNREFQADRPMYRLVTDVTYVPYFENDEWHWGYLSLVQDLFNRAIVAWVYSKSRMFGWDWRHSSFYQAEAWLGERCSTVTAAVSTLLRHSGMRPTAWA